MKLSLDNVEAWTVGDILPPGTHVCRIDNAAEGTSSGGHNQIELDLRCTTGEFIDGTIKDWVVVTANSLGRVRQLLEAAGVVIPDGEFEFDVSQLNGKPVQIIVRQEPKPNGDIVSRVKGYEAVSGNGLAANGSPPAAAVGSAVKDSDVPF